MRCLNEVTKESNPLTMPIIDTETIEAKIAPIIDTETVSVETVEAETTPAIMVSAETIEVETIFSNHFDIFRYESDSTD